MKRLDQLISDVNVQLTMLEAKAFAVPKNHSRETSVISGNISAW